MAESFVQVNIPKTLGKKLKTFETLDGEGNCVESEAVTLTNGCTGSELIGQQPMAGSVPVVLASDQSAIPVSGSFSLSGPADQGNPNSDANSWPVHQVGAIPAGTNVIGAVGIDPSNTGGLALDATITARLNTLGQKPMAASAPVVIASDQSPIPIVGAFVGPVTADQGAPNLDINSWPVHQVGAIPSGTNIIGAVGIDPANTGGLALEATQLTRATEATLATRVADSTITARLNTLGQKPMATSAPVVIASDQSAIPVSAVFGGPVTADQGAPNIDANSWPTHQVGAIPAGANIIGAVGIDPANTGGLALEATLATRASEATLLTRATEATLATRVADATITARLNTLGQKPMATSAPVVIASDQSTIPVSATFGGPVTADQGAPNIDANSWPMHQVGALPAGANIIGQVGIDPANTGGLALEATLATRASEATLATRATEATLLTRVADATITARLNTLGQKPMATSAPVVIASDQSVIPVSATFSGPVTADQGAPNTDPNSWPVHQVGALPAGGNNIGDVDVATLPPVTQGTTPWVVGDGGGSLTVDTPQLPAALVGGRLDENIGAWLGSTAPTVGQKVMAASLPVVVASDQSAIPVTGTFTSTPQVVGAEGNAWAAAAVGAGGTSNSIDCQFTPFVSVFGNADAATTITLQVSQDGVAFYNAMTTTLGGAGDFYIGASIGARFVRLRSSAAATITATIAGKD